MHLVALYAKIVAYGYKTLLDGEDKAGMGASFCDLAFRLAVVSKDILLGSIGNISDERLKLIKTRLSIWINEIK